MLCFADEAGWGVNEELIRVSDTGMAQIREKCVAATDRVIDAIGDDMKEHCPVLTGKLLASINVEHNGLQARVFVGSREAYYWYFVEYGTRYMASQPFVRNALYRKRVLL